MDDVKGQMLNQKQKLKEELRSNAELVNKLKLQLRDTNDKLRNLTSEEVAKLKKKLADALAESEKLANTQKTQKMKSAENQAKIRELEQEIDNAHKNAKEWRNKCREQN